MPHTNNNNNNNNLANTFAITCCALANNVFWLVAGFWFGLLAQSCAAVGMCCHRKPTPLTCRHFTAAVCIMMCLALEVYFCQIAIPFKCCARHGAKPGRQAKQQKASPSYFYHKFMLSPNILQVHIIYLRLKVFALGFFQVFPYSFFIFLCVNFNFSYL